MTALATSTEIIVLGWSVLLLLAQVMLQAGSAAELGPAYILSPRDEQREPENLAAQRLKRALANLLETYPAFVALALALTVSGKAGGLGATGAWIYLGARVVYVVFYAAGIPVVRTLVWLVSVLGLALMLWRLMM